MVKDPWGNDKEPNPWKKKGDSSAEIDELLKKSQEKVRRLMKKGSPSKSAGILWIVLLVIAGWGLTGFYQVQPEEQGVVLRFGKYAYTTTPGLHYHLPYPIEEALTPNVARENRLEIGFRSSMDRRYGVRMRDMKNENIALTGDENIVEIQGAAEHGTYKKAELDALFELGVTSIRKLFEAQRSVLKENELALLK